MGSAFSSRWRAPKPDAEVVETLEILLEAARQGHVRTVAIIAVNPVMQVETATAGDMGGSKRLLVIGALQVFSGQISHAEESSP